MSFSTCDLCDEHPDKVHVVDPVFRDFGGRSVFSGQIVTLKCLEDNSMVREKVTQNGHGCVLVVDGGGITRRALLGDMLAEKAVAHGWEGIVINGAVRDVEIMSQLDIGVKALCAIPVRTDKKGIGEEGMVVRFGGVDFNPGDYLYADANGIIVSATELSAV